MWLLLLLGSLRCLLRSSGWALTGDLWLNLTSQQLLLLKRLLLCAELLKDFFPVLYLCLGLCHPFGDVRYLFGRHSSAIGHLEVVQRLFMALKLDTDSLEFLRDLGPPFVGISWGDIRRWNPTRSGTDDTRTSGNGGCWNC